jgi:hypothetical protein
MNSEMIDKGRTSDFPMNNSPFQIERRNDGNPESLDNLPDASEKCEASGMIEKVQFEVGSI